MAKLIFGLGLVISVAILAIAAIGAPVAGGAGTHNTEPQTALGCNVEKFALDEGYGISRTIERPECAPSK